MLTRRESPIFVFLIFEFRILDTEASVIHEESNHTYGSKDTRMTWYRMQTDDKLAAK